MSRPAFSSMRLTRCSSASIRRSKSRSIPAPFSATVLRATLSAGCDSSSATKDPSLAGQRYRSVTSSTDDRHVPASGRPTVFRGRRHLVTQRRGWVAVGMLLLAIGCAAEDETPSTPDEIPFAPTTEATATIPSAPPTTPAPSTTASPPATETTNYRSCAEVEAAGKAPLMRDDPGYRPGLDRDGDGIACDQEG